MSVTVTEIRTPNGRSAFFSCRDDTTDLNTIVACVVQDEYGLGEHAWSGTALDVGAHIGGVSIMLALDNPSMKVVAVEALPENVNLLEMNALRNGVADRVIVHQAAASSSTWPSIVAYGAEDTDFARQHRFIGNGDWQEVPEARRLKLPSLSLSALVEKHGPFSLLKIDCEGCEWSFLDDPAIAEVQEIRGEYHPREGNRPKELRALLETHNVKLDDSVAFGPFRAVRKMQGFFDRLRSRS